MSHKEEEIEWIIKIIDSGEIEICLQVERMDKDKEDQPYNGTCLTKEEEIENIIKAIDSGEIDECLKVEIMEKDMEED